jgi:mRNA interferase HigB
MQTMESNAFKHFVDLKNTFGSADRVKPHTVFNISGNKYRLIAVVDYALQAVSIECVLTHAEYDEGRWRT